MVPRRELFAPPRGAVEGFLPGTGDEYLAATAACGRFLPRPAVEDDPAEKQIIPYGLLTCGDHVFVMRRSSVGGDRRLREKVSIGVGGHVNPGDQGGDSLAAAVEKALFRELREELRVAAPFRVEVAGIVNDDSNAVGRVHFGIVYRVEVESPAVEVREKESLRGGFVSSREVVQYLEAMETWSRLLAEHFWPV